MKDNKMNFFEFLGFNKMMKDTDPSNIIKLPVKQIETPKSVEPPQPKELYRVGFNDQGMTTLTLIASYGNTMTMTMTQDACEHLIRMLRATYQDSVEDDQPQS